MRLNNPDVNTLTVAETEVFDGTAPTGWVDLNLSGVVGVNLAWVLIKIAKSGALNRQFAFRKNGDTDEFFRSGLLAQTGPGCALITLNDYFHTVHTVATDENGIIEWKCSFAEPDVTIDIIAFIKGQG